MKRQKITREEATLLRIDPAHKFGVQTPNWYSVWASANTEEEALQKTKNEMRTSGFDADGSIKYCILWEVENG